MVHRNAPLTVEGRRVCVSGSIPAARSVTSPPRPVSPGRRSRSGIPAGPGRRGGSGRPVVAADGSPKRTDPEVEDVVEWLRRGMKLGPVMLVAELAEFGIVLAASTIHRILVRRGVSRLR